MVLHQTPQMYIHAKGYTASIHLHDVIVVVLPCVAAPSLSLSVNSLVYFAVSQVFFSFQPHGWSWFPCVPLEERLTSITAVVPDSK